MYLLADLRKVPVFYWDKLDFAAGVGGTILTATGRDAAAQVAVKAQQTQRGKYSIYGNIENRARNHIYGSDVHDILVRQDLSETVRNSEIVRATREAIIFDPWINEVMDINVYKQTDRDGVTRFYEDMTLVTVFGEVQLQGVAISGS